MRFMGRVLAMVVAAAIALPAAPAAAGSQTFCSGLTVCASSGYRHHGYDAAMSTMWWRQYPGPNCTNYVAYRMIHTNGMSTTKPWPEFVNAKDWGRVNAAITDQTPALGAAAWWDENTPGGGSSGHVAYVERVVSTDEIWVSEDSSTSKVFTWRRITRGGSGWPTGFIHFRDLPADSGGVRDLREASREPGAGSATLAWTDPATGPLTGYRVTVGSQAPVTVSSATVTVTGLTRGVGRAVTIEVLGAAGVATGERASAIVTLTPFVDVSVLHVFGPEIDWLANSRITTGYPDGTYRPSDPVLREQMAAFLYRRAGSPPVALPPTSPFADVSPDHAFYREIVWLAGSGITTGYANGDGTQSFRPGEPVLREQMAAFLHRAAGSPALAGPASFTDVPSDHVFTGQIAWLASTGVTTGYADGTFRPAQPVLREQMAAFLFRARML